MRAILAGFGYLGRKIAEQLTKDGFSLLVITRTDRRAESELMPDTHFIGCDLTESAPEIAPGILDTAIFCLAPGNPGRSRQSYTQTYCTAQKNFLESVKARYYVFISSTAVYPDAPGTYTEESACAHSERAEILLSAEKIALEQNNSCVLRFAGLYSADRPIYNAYGTAYSDDKFVHFIHRDDAARAVLHAVKNQLTGIYNVHDGNPQLRSTILNYLRAEKMESQVAARRLLDCGKFYASGFRPIYKDYFAGTGKVQN